MYTKPDDDLNMGLWCCLKLGPEDKFEENLELSQLDESPFVHSYGASGDKSKGKAYGIRRDRRKCPFVGDQCPFVKGTKGKAYGIPSPIPLFLDPDSCVRKGLRGSTL